MTTSPTDSIASTISREHAQHHASSEQASDQATTISPSLSKKKRHPVSKRYLKDRWKSFLSQDAEGNLLVEGVSVKELDAKFGAPMYVLVERELRDRLRTFRNAFPYPKFRPQFA